MCNHILLYRIVIWETLEYHRLPLLLQMTPLLKPFDEMKLSHQAKMYMTVWKDVEIYYLLLSRFWKWFKTFSSSVKCSRCKRKCSVQNEDTREQKIWKLEHCFYLVDLIASSILCFVTKSENFGKKIYQALNKEQTHVIVWKPHGLSIIWIS